MASKSELSFIKSLHQKKYREQHGLFIVEGTKMVNELLTSGFNLYAIYALETYLPSLQISAKLPENVKIAALTEAELQKISTLQTANKVLAVAHLPRNAAEGSRVPGSHPGGAEQKQRLGTAQQQAEHHEAQPHGITQQAEYEKVQPRPKGMWLALDAVRDPGNMGTIIRIADWFGMEGILASEDSVEFYNPKVVQATMGSLFRIKLRQVNLAEALKTAGLPVYGALLDGKSIYEERFAEQGILLLGNESRGISPELAAYITHPVTIPRFGGAESLNVATAAAVICSELRRGDGIGK